MINLIALLQCTQRYLSATLIRQLSRIIPAILAMTGRVTMPGISRWAGQGGSYRTVQRFYHSVLPWVAPILDQISRLGTVHHAPLGFN